MKVIGLKLIFYKDWGQIGCKYFDCSEKVIPLDEIKSWLESNHKNVKKFNLKIIRENNNV